MRSILFSVSLLTAFIFLHFSADAQTTRSRRAVNRQPVNVSNADIAGGLRDALLQGAKNAVRDLGRANGFLDDARVRIPLPKNLQKTEKTLRSLGQGRRVDEFVEAMNHAAEEAVPVAADIFFDSVRQMTFADARDILFGGEPDAATEFFRRTSEDRLRDEFRPIVERFTEKVGVTQKYKAMVGRYSFMGRIVGEDATDLDGYITEKALDGLFLLIAQEEREIRRDPVRRTTSLLRKVFGILR
ncbi:MAG TPA: DUF4197 domain-containing protein [Pyrinomonadaceae bacterium]|jgi:hypothetical protein